MTTDAVEVPSTDATRPRGLDAMGTRARLTAIDWMRGFVMVLMAIDHASGEFNAGRVMADSAFFFKPGTPLPPAQFLTRWMTHLCAPTFVFLAGVSLSISVRRRLAAGESAVSIDRNLFVRGVLIALFEIVPSWFWMPKGEYLFQVLYAIGTSFVLMVPLRRLPTSAIVAIGAGILLSSEAVIGLAGWGPPGKTPLVAGLLLVPGPHGHVMVAYPTLHWLAIMMLGWGLGERLSRRPSPEAFGRELAVGGAFLLALFLVVRGVDGYGNMLLHRGGSSLVAWLHVSKYPPSLSFAALELGIAAVAVAALTVLSRQVRARANGLLMVLGQTPMFFYLLHIPLLALTAQALGVEHKLGLGAAYGFGALVVVVLYPVCRLYRSYKAAHPDGIARYI